MCIVPMHHILLISVTRDGCYCHNMEEEFEDTKGGRGGGVESVYRRRTDNTMTKRKSTKEQTTIYKTYT